MMRPRTNSPCPGTRRDRKRKRRQTNRRRRRALKKSGRKNTQKEIACLKGRRISAADQINRDLTINCKGEKFYDTRIKIRPLERLPTSYAGFQKLGIYSSNDLCAIRSRSINHPINKAARFFGIDPKKDRHWAALLRVIVCCGLNAADFRSVMRIRDIKIRGKIRSYRKAVTGFIGRCPKAHVRRALDLSFERW